MTAGVLLRVIFSNKFVEKVDRKKRLYQQSKKNTIKCLRKLYKKEFTHKYEKHEGCCYVVPRINYGAGVGHQLACWAAGYNFSEYYNIGFVNPHLWINGGHQEEDDKVVETYGIFKCEKSSLVWDKLLGIDSVGIDLNDIELQKYRLIELPPFSQTDISCMLEIEKLLYECNKKNVIFILALDQNFRGWPTAKFLQDNFWNSEIRKNDNIKYSKSTYNIAIHVRRGDVTSSMVERYKSDEFYLEAIKSIRNVSNNKGKPVRFYIISEGPESNFKEFVSNSDVELLVSMNSKEAFLHLIYADACLISPSGFAAIAAAISHGERYSPSEYRVFSDEIRWTYLNEDGRIINS